MKKRLHKNVVVAVWQWMMMVARFTEKSAMARIKVYMYISNEKTATGNQL